MLTPVRLTRAAAPAVILLALALLLPRSATAAPPALAPLPAESQRALQAIPEDPPPPKLTKDMHFLVSDEEYPERFRDALAGQGGMLVGVGPEQNYFFCGWARPEVLVIVDFDQVVIDLHDVYRVLFLNAQTPDELIDLWAEENASQSAALLAGAITSAPRLARAESAFRLGRKNIHFRLAGHKRRLAALGIKSFLTDQAQYDYVVALLRAGRVRALRGDFTADQSLLGLAQASRQMSIPVRTLYLSNVEHYFPYLDGFRRNMLALSTDDRSLVLRTVVVGLTRESRYKYMAQKAEDFKAWLRQDAIKRVTDMLSQARAERRDRTWFIPGPGRG